MNQAEMMTGWSESAPGRMMCNTDPKFGGIIDSEIVSGRWFVIFNDEKLQALDGFETRGQAIQAFQQTIGNHHVD